MLNNVQLMCHKHIKNCTKSYEKLFYTPIKKPFFQEVSNSINLNALKTFSFTTCKSSKMTAKEMGDALYSLNPGSLIRLFHLNKVYVSTNTFSFKHVLKHTA